MSHSRTPRTRLPFIGWGLPPSYLSYLDADQSRGRSLGFGGGEEAHFSLHIWRELVQLGSPGSQTLCCACSLTPSLSLPVPLQGRGFILWVSRMTWASRRRLFLCTRSTVLLTPRQRHSRDPHFAPGAQGDSDKKKSVVFPPARAYHPPHSTGATAAVGRDRKSSSPISGSHLYTSCSLMPP